MKVNLFDSAFIMALATRSPRSPGGSFGGEGSECLRKKQEEEQLKETTDFDENSEYANLADKVFQNINAVFDKDENLDEFDIIPVGSMSNHSPVLHAALEHKLAIESWCIPYLYTHSYKMILAIRAKQKCSSSLSLSSQAAQQGRNGNGGGTEGKRYGSLKAAKMSELDRISKGLLYSRILVLLNPDLAVAWNFRKDYVPVVTQAAFEGELRLTSLVATRKPKCPEGFAYRRWLVNKAFQNRLMALENIHDWFSGEISNLEIPIIRYPSNYHPWSYRLWLLQKILQDYEVPKDEKNLVLQSELSYTQKWMNSNVSDYCGHHYRQKLLELMSQEFQHSVGAESLVVKLVKELEDNAKRIEMFEGHETLWYHRRAVLKILASHLLQTSDDEQVSLAVLKEKEQQFLTSIVGNSTNYVNECTLVNASHCKKHMEWVKVHLQWEFQLQA